VNSVRNNIIGKQKKTPSAELGGTIGSYTTYDSQYQWSHPWNGSVAVGVLNAFDKDFPRDDNERIGDDQRVSELYTANGRMFYVNLNQTF
jgi:outer membrane receptor for ferrienterochelin and colicin